MCLNDFVVVSINVYVCVLVRVCWKSWWVVYRYPCKRSVITFLFLQHYNNNTSFWFQGYHTLLTSAIGLPLALYQVSLKSKDTLSCCFCWVFVITWPYVQIYATLKRCGYVVVRRCFVGWVEWSECLHNGLEIVSQENTQYHKFTAIYAAYTGGCFDNFIAVFRQLRFPQKLTMKTVCLCCFRLSGKLESVCPLCRVSNLPVEVNTGRGGG